MRIRGFGYALSGCAAAALLAACGGPQSQLPIVAPGEMPLQAQTQFGSTAAGTSAIKPTLQSPGYKVTNGLLYVANYDINDVTVYNARVNDPPVLATISEDVNTPSGACVDGHGTLYITNSPPSGPGWISEYPLGETAPSKIITDGINGPSFCAIDAQGNLWVTNLNSRNVTEYLAGSKKPHTVITSGLVYPDGVAIDQSGNLYVANGPGTPTRNVEVYAPGSNSPSRTITDGVTWPVGIAVDSNGTLYVANTETNNIEEYRSGQGEPFQTITEAMHFPADMTVDNKDALYVTNYGNNTVVEFAPGSLKPKKRQISQGLYAPQGIAYYPAVLP
jgi:hypothetical protein